MDGSSVGMSSSSWCSSSPLGNLQVLHTAQPLATTYSAGYLRHGTVAQPRCVATWRTVLQHGRTVLQHDAPCCDVRARWHGHQNCVGKACCDEQRKGYPFGRIGNGYGDEQGGEHGEGDSGSTRLRAMRHSDARRYSKYSQRGYS